MRSVNIADLKNNLSRYLNKVRDGEEVLIRDRNRPIAKIVPLAQADDLDEHILSLAVQGKARLPESSIPSEFWSEPRPRVALRKLVDAVSADRDEN
jgi:prevent-host-death family protein